MPFDRPGLTELRQQAMQDVTASDLPNADGLLRKAVLRVLAWVQAGLAHLHYGYLDWIAHQAVPFTATDEYLEGWAGLRGVTRKDATLASGSAQFTGVPTTVVPAGTIIIRGDGFQYVATADTAVAGGGTVTVPIEATVAGEEGNADSGIQLSLGSSIAGVNAAGAASTVITGGTDQEKDDPFRTRMLQVYAAPPQGGDRLDYIEWALAVPGVTRAWVAPHGGGPGTVVVFVMLDEAEAAHDGFPQGTNGVATNDDRDATATGDQLAVADAIYARQPVTALVYVSAPVPEPVDFTVSDLGTSNTLAMQAAIRAALEDMLLRLGAVGGTVDPATGAAWDPIDASAWYAALEAIPGIGQFKVEVPATAIAPSSAHLLTVGTITFNT